MAITPLTLLKAHVRAQDFDDDDPYLAHLLETAETAVVRATRRPLPELMEAGGGDFPVELTHAALLLAGEWYASKEAAANVERRPVPHGVDMLVQPFKRVRP